MHVDDEDEAPRTAEGLLRGTANQSDSGSPETLMSSPTFGRDERIWAQDPSKAGGTAPGYYPAAIRDVRWEHNAGWKYRVHYQGWNSRWDRWLSPQQIASREQEEALRAAGLLSSSAAVAGNAVAAQEDVENEEALVNASRRKRKLQGGEDGTTDKASTAFVNRKRRTVPRKQQQRLPYAEACELPLTLQTVLVEEWERLTRPQTKLGKPPVRQLHALPASVTIQQVLKHFCKKQTKQLTVVSEKKEGLAGAEENPTRDAAAVHDFCSGLHELFQTALPTCLLYNQELPQYEALLRDPVLSRKPWTEVYGCEYLLRLYVRLPFLLPGDRKSSVMGPLLSDLLVLLQKNRQTCFKGDYRRVQRDEWLAPEVRLGEAPSTMETLK
jgi:mortality factor 4-like protein 1